MGKRSEFERVEKDFYRTIDSRAVDALAPHLKPSTTYAEPCFGEGDLVQSLAIKGHHAAYVSDISSGKDALTLTSSDLYGCECIITNPPWSRPVLHQMIDVFTWAAPYVWLLFDADWAHTKQSAKYMSVCTDIVSVGRLIWIPGTTMTGKDNCAWYRFSLDKKEPTRFFGR